MAGGEEDSLADLGRARWHDIRRGRTRRDDEEAGPLPQQPANLQRALQRRNRRWRGSCRSRPALGASRTRVPYGRLPFDIRLRAGAGRGTGGRACLTARRAGHRQKSAAPEPRYRGRRTRRLTSGASARVLVAADRKQACDVASFWLTVISTPVGCLGKAAASYRDRTAASSRRQKRRRDRRKSIVA